MGQVLEASRLHSARARAVRWFHLLPTTSQFTMGRCATVALSEFVTAWLRVIEIGAANGDYGAKDNADKDTHDENSSFPTSNAADDREFPLVREGPASNYDSQGGAFWVARR